MIEDVINDVRDIFLDDGVDEQVLMELKTVSSSLLLTVPHQSLYPKMSL